MVQIIPAILATIKKDYLAAIEKLNNSQSFQKGWVHIDFMDNKFVPNGSIKPSDVSKEDTKLKKEAHLMVDHPLEWIDSLSETGFKRVLFHIECKDDMLEVIDSIKKKGMEAGLVLKDEAPIENLSSFISEVDVVLIMGVEPGFQGQQFIPETIDKIREASRLRSKGNHTFRIGVDGGISAENAKLIVDAGADILVSGSYLLKGDLDKNMENLWGVINA